MVKIVYCVLPHAYGMIVYVLNILDNVMLKIKILCVCMCVTIDDICIKRNIKFKC